MRILTRYILREITGAARYTTAAPGGHGAVREFAETFLQARGAWDGVVQAYLQEHGDAAS